MQTPTLSKEEIEMNRTLRTLKMLVAAAAAAAAVALVALSFAGTGQAFDSNDCRNMFPVTLQRTDHIKIDTGKVDFADNAHLFGSPVGTAVICWSNDGRVGMKGRVFSDPGTFYPDNQYATARIWFFDINAGLWRYQGAFSTALSNSLQSTRPGGLDGLRSPAGAFSAVRIQLSVTTEGGLGGLSTRVVTTPTWFSP
jgi:hypothetical protein